ncbi:hypothetical protein AAHB34_12870 [Paenarthrobacter ureafaciens]
MTTTPYGRFTAFLLRAGFLTAALAIIAGIFGMHVMTGAHHMAPGPGMTAAGPSTLQLQAMPAGHSHVTGTTTGAAAIETAVTGGSSSTCAPAGSCPEMSAGDGACVLGPRETPPSQPRCREQPPMSCLLLVPPLLSAAPTPTHRAAPPPVTSVSAGRKPLLCAELSTGAPSSQ